MAAKNNQIQVVQLLVKNGAYLEATDVEGFTPLHAAVYFGHAEVVQILLSAGADFLATSGPNSRYTPLHMAARHGHLGLAMLLLERMGPHVDPREKNGYTPLHCSAMEGHVDISKALILAGADLGARDHAGHTPLAYAASHGHTKVVELLLEHEANPSC
jgi:ankyrin repeat protein